MKEKTEMSLSMTNDEMHCIYTLALFWLMSKKPNEYEDERLALSRFAKFLKSSEAEEYRISCEVDVEDLSDVLIF